MNPRVRSVKAKPDYLLDLSWDALYILSKPAGAE